MTPDTARSIAHALDVNLYRDPQRSSAKFSAQSELDGRTHYVSDNTLRFHKSRILGASPQFNGLFFRITESCAVDFHNTRRGFRCVLFDLTGEVVYHPKLDAMARSAEDARRAFWVLFDTFDPQAYYRQKLAEKGARLLRQAHDMQQLADTLGATVEAA
jgi:hypothetical protein